MSRAIGEPPNVENTVPLQLFRAQSPARYSHMDGDKAVLYAGAIHTKVQVSGDEQHGLFQMASQHPVTIYVLNTSLVLYVPSLHTGVDIPYTSIVLHAMKENLGQEVLYLQIMSNQTMNTTELEITEADKSEAEKSEAEKSEADKNELETKLSRNSNDGLVFKSATVAELYDALSTCSSFHYDSESESESCANFVSNSGNLASNLAPNSTSNLTFNTSSQWFTAENLPSEPIAVPSNWLNCGTADDLGMDMHDETDSQEEAGMNIALSHQPVAGVSRRSDAFEGGDKKRRI